MAWRASKTKLVKSKYLISAILLASLVPYIINFGNYIGHEYNEGRGNLMIQCMGEEKTKVTCLLEFDLFSWIVQK